MDWSRRLRETHGRGAIWQTGGDMELEYRECSKSGVCCRLWACFITKLSLTVCDPMDYSPPGSSLPGILQARILGGCHFPLQGTFPTSLILLRWQVHSLPLSHQEAQILWQRKIIKYPVQLSQRQEGICSILASN